MDKKNSKKGRVLRILYHNQNKWLDLGEIRRKICFDRTTISYILNELHGESYVRRRQIKGKFPVCKISYWQLSKNGLKLMNWIKNQGEL